MGILKIFFHLSTYLPTCGKHINKLTNLIFCGVDLRMKTEYVFEKWELVYAFIDFMFPIDLLSLFEMIRLKMVYKKRTPWQIQL